MIDVKENSPLAILNFAYWASCADGVLSQTELNMIFSESETIRNITNSLLSLDGGSREFKERQKAEIDKYLDSLRVYDSSSDLNLNFHEAASKITAFSLQPFSIAIAIKVASADGFHASEKDFIYKQKDEWDCEQADVDSFLQKIEKN